MTFRVITDKNIEYIVVKDNLKKQLRCKCPFALMNDMICAHIFCLMTALQIKSLKYLSQYKRWDRDADIIDPSIEGMMSNKKQRMIKSYMDKASDQVRSQKARQKGSIVPLKKKKVEIEYYSDDPNDTAPKKTQVYALNVPKGLKIKAFSKEEERER